MTVGEPPQEWPSDRLKEYFEAILREQRIAIDMASEEREKAAQIARDATVRQIDQGDASLRQHISDQVSQITQLIESQARLVETVSLASEKAILKAEVAAERRFESVNEWRAQSLDRERSMQEQTATFVRTLMPREVSETNAATMASQIHGLQQFQAKIVGALALVGIVVPLLTGLAVYLLTRGAQGG